MKCDQCGIEVESIYGGYGKKLCEWCYAVQEYDAENNTDHGDRLFGTMLISIIYAALGFLAGWFLRGAN